jgi:hypothetical protein
MLEIVVAVIVVLISLESFKAGEHNNAPVPKT